MRFSIEELKQLTRAWLVISVAFAILLSGFSLSAEFAVAVVIAAITVGLGFLLHELAHKYLAQRYGCRAEFRSFDTMLLLTLVMSFFGFVIAAPGAVFIHGNINMARNGRISAVGPLVNIVLALIFFAFIIAASLLYANQILLNILYYGLSINSWLAFFNLIPVWHLDGAKVFRWNKKIYAGMMAAAFISMLLPGFVRFG